MGLNHKQGEQNRGDNAWEGQRQQQKMNGNNK